MVTKRVVKSKKLKVISMCSVCGEPVAARDDDTAYRHGFNRHKLAMSGVQNRKFSQEDGAACKGSGKAVIYKRKTK